MNRIGIFSAVAAGLLAVAPAARAQEFPPEIVAYQGRLTDPSGAPLSGSFPMEFRLFDVPEAGSPLLTDAQTVTAADGLYVAHLGLGALTAGTEWRPEGVFANHGETWLEVAVAGETLSPRMRLASVPYALNSRSLGGRFPASFLDVSGSLQSKAGGLLLGGPLSAASLRASVTDASVFAATLLTLDHAYAPGPGPAGIGSRIVFRAEDGSGAMAETAWIVASLTKTSGRGGASNSGALRFMVNRAGTMKEGLRIDDANRTILSLSGGSAPASFRNMLGPATPPVQGIFLGAPNASSAGVIGVRDDSHHIRIDAAANLMTFHEYGGFLWRTGSHTHSPLNVMRLTAGGDLILRGRLRQRGSPDVAENIPAAAGVEAGDVVAVDPDHDERVVLSSRPHQTDVLGVISTDPGHLLNSRQIDDADAPRFGGPPPDASTLHAPTLPRSFDRPLTLCGRVPVKVTLEGGPIRRGDLLTASSTPGHAMRAAEPWRGGILGTALQEFDEAPEGLTAQSSGGRDFMPALSKAEGPARTGRILVFVHLNPAPASGGEWDGLRREIGALRAGLDALKRRDASPVAGGSR
jgi:hypothetical protein